MVHRTLSPRHRLRSADDGSRRPDGTARRPGGSPRRSDDGGRGLPTPNRPARQPRTLLVGLLALVLAATGAVAGCGDESAGADTDELLVGYQRFGGLSLVKARNGAPEVKWSLFESGPALTEALKAGAIDIGQVGEAPPVFAAAGKIRFRIIGTSEPVPQGEAVLVKEAKGYRSFADLRGGRSPSTRGRTSTGCWSSCWKRTT
ncbi:type 2 periplasmic-binding domain-containing protein [Plantactinospora veratri]